MVFSWLFNLHYYTCISDCNMIGLKNLHRTFIQSQVSVQSAPKQNGLDFAQLWTAFEPALEGEHTFIAMVIGYVTTFVPISIMSALSRNINHKNLWHPIKVKPFSTNLVVHEGLQTSHTFMLNSFINIPSLWAGIPQVFN